MGGGKPIAALFAEQRQAAERRLNGAAQPIVDAHLVELVGIDLAEIRAVDRVENVIGIAAFLRSDDPLVFGDEERPRRQRPENAHGARIPERGERLHGVELRVEILGAELLHQLGQIGRRGKLRPGKKRQDRDDEAAKQ